MDEGNALLSSANDDRSPSRLAHDAAQLRGNLDGIVNELDQRRKLLFDWRYQLRKNGALLAIAGGAALLLLAASIVGKRNTRARGEPSFLVKLLMTAATSAIGILTRSVTARIVAQPRLLPP